MPRQNPGVQEFKNLVFLFAFQENKKPKLCHYVTTRSSVFLSTADGRLVEVSVDCFYWLGNGDLIKQ